MKLEYSICGNKYLPLRAVGAITSGRLNGQRLTEMIVDYEGWHDDDYPGVIVPYLWKAPGRLLPVYGSAFAGSSSTPGRAPLFGGAGFPAGLLVATSAVKSKFDLFVAKISPQNRKRFAVVDDVWDSSPALAAQDRALVLAGLPALRTNSALLLDAEILAVVEMIEAICLREGSPISRAELPGTKKLWLPIFAKHAPLTMTRRLPTLADHFHSLGLFWRQGVDAAATATWKANMTKSGLL